jgi:hypothetical protein
MLPPQQFGFCRLDDGREGFEGSTLEVSVKKNGKDVQY